MRNELVKSVGEGGVRILADLGITTQQDGKLKIDDTKLGKALSEGFESVASLFTGDSGLMSRLNAKLDPYTQTGGVLEQRLSGLNGTMNSIDDQREALTRRLTQLQTRLLSQFNAMDSLVGQLNQTASRLEQAFKSLPGMSE
jgi:flagellar hook-associated protein 2